MTDEQKRELIAGLFRDARNSPLSVGYQDPAIWPMDEHRAASAIAIWEGAAECESCGGFGEQVTMRSTPQGPHETRVDCDDCGGSGAPAPAAPADEQEWEAHRAAYRLTVQQRDRAWREVERLEAELHARPAAADGEVRALEKILEEVEAALREHEGTTNTGWISPLRHWLAVERKRVASPESWETLQDPLWYLRPKLGKILGNDGERINEILGLVCTRAAMHALMESFGVRALAARTPGETPTREQAQSPCEKWDCDGDHRYYSHDPETGKLVPWSDEL